jgi:hypothetical protein
MYRNTSISIYLCRKRNTIYYIIRIKKSIVTLIYRELLVLGRKIDIFKLIYRSLVATSADSVPSSYIVLRERSGLTRGLPIDIQIFACLWQVNIY